jgi:hypothetical protein
VNDATWLSCHALTVKFQKDLTSNRSKNTVILEYQNPRTEQIDVVGGIDLHDAISRADTRIQCSPVPVPEKLSHLLEKFSAAIDSAENRA